MVYFFFSYIVKTGMVTMYYKMSAIKPFKIWPLPTSLFVSKK